MLLSIRAFCVEARVLSSLVSQTFQIYAEQFRYLRPPFRVKGGFLNFGGSIGFVLLDTAWSRVSWDGRIDQVSEATPAAPPLLSPGAWGALELELSRDSELRLLVVVMRVRVL